MNPEDPVIVETDDEPGISTPTLYRNGFVYPGRKRDCSAFGESILNVADDAQLPPVGGRDSKFRHTTPVDIGNG